MAMAARQRLFLRMLSISRVVGPLTVAFGVVGLGGWILNLSILKSIFVGLAPMKPNTAVAFILCGGSLWALHPQFEPIKKDWRSYIGVIAAVVATLIGLLTLLEYAFNVSLHIDELLFRETRSNVHFPGRMSPQAALCIFFSSSALLLFRAKNLTARRATHWLASASTFIAFAALLGYAYSISVFYRLESYTGMALHTAVAVVLLDIGLVCARPQYGFWSALFKGTPGSVMLRRALPFAVGGAFVLGWLRLEGQRLGLFGLEMGVAFLASSASFVFFLTVTWASKAVDEATARESEQLRLALEATSTGMLSVDQTGRIVLVNAQVEHQFGYSRAELVGHSIEMLVPQRFRQELSQCVAAFFTGSDASPAGTGRDLYGLRKDDTEVPIELTHRPLQTSEGKFVLSSIVDIAERKRIETSLRERDERFHMMISAVQDYAIFMLDPQGCILSWNAGAERLNGYTAGEILGKHFSTFYRREQVQWGHPQCGLKVATEAGRFEEEGWRVRKDGSLFWANMIITPVRNNDNVLVGYTKITRDLTARKGTEEQFRLAMEAAPTGMIIADPQGKMVLLNRQAEKMLGYGREELIGRPIEMLIPRHPEMLRDLQSEVERAPQLRPMDTWGRRKDGWEIPIEISLSPIETPIGDFVLNSIVDITERKRAEEEHTLFVERLQNFNLELEERVRSRTAALSNTLNERETLLQEIHHRVKNNLQVISSLINLQMRRVPDDPSREALEECRTRVSAIGLIHEMLYQSKDYANVPFTTYAQRLAVNVFQISRAESDRVNLKLASAVELRLPVDKAVPCALILNELISNSLKHAFPNDRRGTIQIEFTSLKEGQFFLSVSDDGVGIPADFDLRRASSLGMNLIRTLAGQLAADLTMKTESNQGTSFTIAFAADSSKTLAPATPALV